MQASREIYRSRVERGLLLAIAAAFALGLAYQLGRYLFDTFAGDHATLNLPAAAALFVMAVAFGWAAMSQTVLTVDDRELRVMATYLLALKRTRSIPIAEIECVKAGRDSGNDSQLELRMCDGSELFIHGGGEAAAHWLRDVLEARGQSVSDEISKRPVARQGGR